MNKFALIGYPLGHSLSAIIQKVGLESIGMEGSYELLETTPENLVDRIKYLKTQDFDGFNVTIPLKVPMGLFLDEVDTSANFTTCANTVKINPDKSLKGYNTDVYGFKTAMPLDIQEQIKGQTVSLLGLGGASRAAISALVEIGVKEIEIYVRNIMNARETVNYFRKTFPNTEFNIYQIHTMRSLSHTSMLINTTPVGMRGHSMDKSPIETFNISELNKNCVVYDVIYNPQKTVLIKEAEQFGLKTISGLDMLIYQGAKSLEIWTGQIPDTNLMKIAALENL